MRTDAHDVAGVGAPAFELLLTHTAILTDDTAQAAPPHASGQCA
jgi:hypothetical protein